MLLTGRLWVHSKSVTGVLAWNDCICFLSVVSPLPYSEAVFAATDLDLISNLQAIPDAGVRRGLRITARSLLLVLGILSDWQSLRALVRFARRHHDALTKWLRLSLRGDSFGCLRSVGGPFHPMASFTSIPSPVAFDRSVIRTASPRVHCGCAAWIHQGAATHLRIDQPMVTALHPLAHPCLQPGQGLRKQRLSQRAAL